MVSGRREPDEGEAFPAEDLFGAVDRRGENILLISYQLGELKKAVTDLRTEFKLSMSDLEVKVDANMEEGTQHLDHLRTEVEELKAWRREVEKAEVVASVTKQNRFSSGQLLLAFMGVCAAFGTIIVAIAGIIVTILLT